MNLMTKTVLATAGLALLCGSAQAQLSFEPPFTVFVGNEPDAVATTDFDGDGDIDYAVTVDNPDRLVIFLNDGMANFTQGPLALLGSNAGAGDVVAFDADGDGDDDFAVARQNQADVMILLNNGGVLSQLTTVNVGQNPRGLDAGDYDGDGDVDLVVANRDGNTASVITNTGGGFSSQTIGVGNEPRHAAFLDADNDGDLDVVVSNHDSDNVSLLTNTGGGFSSAIIASNLPDSPEGMAAGDFNGDGNDDFATTGDAFVFVFSGNGNGTFSGPSFVVAGGQSTDDIIAVDFDCDGDLDFATSNQDSNSASVIENLGGGSYASPIMISTGNEPEQIGAGDFDGNGSPDLAVPNNSSDTVTIAINSLACDGGPATGACCLEDGSCSDAIAEADCVASGGTYQGDGSMCAMVECPAPPVTGACCFEDTTCGDGISEADCIASGGTFQGADTICAMVECPPPPPTCDGDINGDGVVDSADLNIVLGDFGKNCN